MFDTFPAPARLLLRVQRGAQMERAVRLRLVFITLNVHLALGIDGTVAA